MKLYRLLFARAIFRLLALASVVAAASSTGPPRAEVLARLPKIALWCSGNHSHSPNVNAEKVITGADVLESERFAPLKGLRVGLIANQTSIDGAGRNVAHMMRSAPGVKLAAIFTPEHGFSGLAEGRVESGTDTETGTPIFSLYGDSRKPTDAMLDGIDALVFDLQDSGARFYTYATTMAYAMEAAAPRGIDFYVLDRPNPISAAIVQGVVMDPELKSFIGYFPMPTRHGMTVGELAEMFNVENRIGARLHVIRMHGYHRSEWYDQTGLRWIPPSPNLRTLTEATLYPGVGMAEGANVSVCRGTDTPFEVIGAPWITASTLSSYLNSRPIAGVHFEPIEFTPSSDTYANQECNGVRITLDDRAALDSPALGVEIIAALHRLYPGKFELDKNRERVGSTRVLEQIRSGEDPRVIVQDWHPVLRKFRLLRAQYLFY